MLNKLTKIGISVLMVCFLLDISYASKRLDKKVYLGYDVFKERNEETFKLFDSIKLKNIYRIYPHTHLCNKIIKNRCVVNSQKDILYWDDDHLSLKGSELVVNDILEKLKIIDKN